MRKIFILGIVGMLLLLTSSAMALEIEMNWFAGYQSGSGGEFSVKPIDFGWVLGNYDAKAKYGDDYFQSFCIEKNEYVLKKKYFASIDDGAIKGGVRGGNPDPISIGTAYLYSQFARGVLEGYDYDPMGGRSTAAALQDAFWWLEDEITLTNPAGNQFLNLALTNLGYSANNDYNALKANSGGAYGVKALNIWDNLTTYSEPDQSQLVLVPEPGTVILLGASLLGLAAIRRRRK